MGRVLIVFLAFVLGCYTSLDSADEALSVSCEHYLPGECYLGRWVARQGECACARTRDECDAACGPLSVASWEPFTCMCGGPR